MSLDEYLSLLDWVGRELRADKRGVIPAHLAPILGRPQIAGDELVDTMGQLHRLFPRMVGTAEQLVERAKQVSRQWFHGVRAVRPIFPASIPLGSAARYRMRKLVGLTALVSRERDRIRVAPRSPCWARAPVHDAPLIQTRGSRPSPPAPPSPSPQNKFGERGARVKRWYLAAVGLT